MPETRPAVSILIAPSLRTILLAGLLALAVGLATPSPGAAAQATQPYPDTPLVGAHSARAFGDSVGVNVHLSWLDTSYGDFNTLQARLRELGVRYVRDGLCATCEYQIDRLRGLAAAGIRAHIIVGDLARGTSMMQENLRAIRNRLRAAVISVGAPNEPNLSGDPQWVAKARAYQQELYVRVKSDPALAALPVLGPAVGWPASPGDLGNLSQVLDRGNFHPYPGGNPPYHNLGPERFRAAAVSGTKPVVATELGYHSDLATTSGHLPASERAIAFYMPRAALEGYIGGVERTYIYQLADPWPDAARPAGLELMENRFGLLRSNLTPKPSFLALRNLLGAVNGDSPPVAAPGGLRFALEGAGPDVRQLLLHSANGSYSLVLWRTAAVWDPAVRRDLNPAADPLEVVLGQPVSLARRFEPVVSDAELQRWANPTRIPVDLAGGPVVLKLTPPGAPAALPAPSACAALAPGRPSKAKRRRGCCRTGRARTRGAKVRTASARKALRRSRATWRKVSPRRCRP